jgi:hypothetical protein
MSAKSMKSAAFALFASVLGFATAPAFAQNAASVIQTSEQNTVQNGSGNVSIQGNVQTGVVTQTGSPYGYGVQCFVAPCPGGGSINGASVVQQNQQDVAQFGYGNTAIQGNSSTANVHQGGYPSYPYSYPSSINGATVGQFNQQNIGQFGFGNSAIQGNAADAHVTQH